MDGKTLYERAFAKLAGSDPFSLEQAPRDKASLERRFKTLAKRLETDGVLAGTYHKRVGVPKSKLTEEDLIRLGFIPVAVAIPEAGQDRLTSYRHPDSTYHLHSHHDKWVMHQDEHPASTMLAMKEETKKGKAKAMAQGLPHVLGEGVPGLYAYVRGMMSGHGSTADKVFDEMGASARRAINRLKSRE